MSRPRKTILIYHPNKGAMSLYRYAIAVTMPFRVHSAASARELRQPRPDIEVTLLWKASCIEIRNHLSGTFRRLPIGTSNYELREALRIGARRKKGPRSVSA